MGCASSRARPLRDASGALRLDALRRHAEAQFEDTPRFRQVITQLPFDQGLAWVDDERFDPAHHIRAAALPHPGGEAELRRFMSHFLETPLDPTRPLWEMWLVDGLRDDRVALVVKASHVLVDGMALLGLALRLVDAEPRDHDEVPRTWHASPRPTDAELLVTGLTDRAGRAARGLWDAATLVTDPRFLAAAAGSLRRIGAGGVERAPALPLTRPVGPHRGFVWTRLSMADVLTVKRASGATVNDVVLAVVSGALARYLSSDGESLPGSSPRVLVPVSTHGTAPGQEVQNSFSMIVVDLPLHLDDPLERLHTLHEQMDRHKRSVQTTLGTKLFRLVDLLPSWLVRQGGPPILHRQPVVNLAVTNLPGARDEAYLLGARMLELFPFITVTGNLGMIIGVLSYADGLGVSITVDSDVVADADSLLDAFGPALRELVEAVRGDQEHHERPARGMIEPMPDLEAEYEPSPRGWVRDQVAAYEASGGTEANTLRDTGLPIILVTTVGNKTGKIRKIPLMRVEHDGEYALVASVGGAPKHPVWYWNLKADPTSVRLQDGPEPFPVDIRELEGDERATWWERAVAAYPPYADYQAATERHIPVFLATRRA